MITVKNINSKNVTKDFDERKIEYAFHDIDGTHSLIRDWPPVMSICLYDVIENGLSDDFDSPHNAKRLISLAGTRELPETDAFCVESAGLSALTQMEWAIRRSVQEGKIQVNCNGDTNTLIIERINNGEEYYDDLPETAEMNEMLKSQTPRLFKLYENVLNGYCRDKNLMLAKENPEKVRVKGSYEFLKYLHENGVKNYFVTGAVVEKGMGMHEEVEALGYSIGKGQLIEEIIGSTWTEKKPKDAVMKDLIKDLSISAENVLVIGDGRAEIQAGVELGALVISRLSENATYQRGLHKKLGTNVIVEDFTNTDFYDMFKEIE